MCQLHFEGHTFFVCAFTKYSPVSGAVARERKMNETQSLPSRRSKSSAGDLYGSEMFIDGNTFKEEDACI